MNIAVLRLPDAYLSRPAFMPSLSRQLNSTKHTSTRATKEVRGGMS